MSLAENLLNSLDENAYQNSGISGIEPEEEHIVVGENRAITVPNKLKIIAVTGDKDIETVSIDCIRYWDGHDLSSFAVYINYRLPNGETGTYIPQNITKNDDHFTFEWVIGREITQYNGKISFLILARQVDDSGNLLYQWSSLLNDECAISQGLDITNIAEEELSQDVVTQILQNLNSKLSYSNISNELGYSEGTVLSQKTTTIELNRRANALKGTVSGSVVAMKDVSPLEHELDVKVSRKNLLPPIYVDGNKTENGITFTKNADGTVTANGTATTRTVYTVRWDNTIPIIELEIDKAYTLSGCPAGGGDATYFLQCANGGKYSTESGAGVAFTALATGIDVYIIIVAGVTVDNLVFKPQLEVGTVATPYAPYIEDISSVEVKRYGKNLLPYPYSVKTKTENGITIADNGDGARTFDGTATSLVEIHLGSVNVRNGVQYTISSNLTGSSSSTYKMWFKSRGGGVENYFDIEKYGVTFTPTTDDIIEVFLYIYENATVNNMVFKPQLEVGTTATPYEPYIEPTTYTVEADGTVKGVTPLYPSTTLITDNRAIIECEYNRDINKAFEELRQIIISLGGNI